MGRLYYICQIDSANTSKIYCKKRLVYLFNYVISRYKSLEMISESDKDLLDVFNSLIKYKLKEISG